MNTPNNKRKKESIERIEKVFISLLQTNELNEISVSDICKLAGLNRTIFMQIIRIFTDWLTLYGTSWNITYLTCTKMKSPGDSTVTIILNCSAT